jgi:hypothetical protein
MSNQMGHDKVKKKVNVALSPIDLFSLVTRNKTELEMRTGGNTKYKNSIDRDNSLRSEVKSNLSEVKLALPAQLPTNKIRYGPQEMTPMKDKFDHVNFN